MSGVLRSKVEENSKEDLDCWNNFMEKVLIELGVERRRELVEQKEVWIPGWETF